MNDCFKFVHLFPNTAYMMSVFLYLYVNIYCLGCIFNLLIFKNRFLICFLLLEVMG